MTTEARLEAIRELALEGQEQIANNDEEGVRLALAEILRLEAG